MEGGETSILCAASQHISIVHHPVDATEHLCGYVYSQFDPSGTNSSCTVPSVLPSALKQAIHIGANLSGIL